MYNFLYFLIFSLSLIVIVNQYICFKEFNFHIENIKKVILDKNFEEKKYLKLEYNYNLARANYIYAVCFSYFLKIYFKKYLIYEYIDF